MVFTEGDFMYKKNAVEAINRLKSFRQRRMNDRILATIPVNNIYWKKYEESKGWNGNEGATDRQCLCVENIEEVHRIWDNQLKIYQDIEDDSVPIAYPTIHYGESIFAGFLGADIKFVGTDFNTWSSSKPLIENWGDIDKLQFNEENFWAKNFKKTLEYFVENGKNKFGIRTFITYDALNFVVELRGATQALYDINDYPAEVRKLMDFGVDFNIRVLEMQRKIIENYNKETFSDDEFSSLVMAHAKPLLSVDAYTMCNVNIYREMGFEYQQKLISHFGGGFIHTHGQNLYNLLPEIVKLKGIVELELGDDVSAGQPRPFEKLKEIREMTGDIPLETRCSKDEFIKGLENKNLPGGVRYTVNGVNLPDEANELMKKVRDYYLK